jgi:uncharacterized protein YbjT (DUF2867 family)
MSHDSRLRRPSIITRNASAHLNMKVAVIGGTGSIGSLVVADLAALGDDVRAVSRHAPATLPAGAVHRRADIRSGEGLASALEGVEVVVDAVNDQRAANRVLVDGSRRLLAAEVEADVTHHVAISIVGCDRLPGGYYRAKVAQEQVVRTGMVPWSLLRTTQFHPLIAALFAGAARWHVTPTGKARVQPIAPAVVAARLARVVHTSPGGDLGDLGGPEIRTLTDLSREWRQHSGRHPLPVRIAIPGRAGRALREGAACAPDALSGGPTFAEWLATNSDREREPAA